MNDDVLAAIERTNELLQRVLAEVATTPATHAVFVDAGYVYAAAGRLLAGGHVAAPRVPRETRRDAPSPPASCTPHLARRSPPAYGSDLPGSPGIIPTREDVHFGGARVAAQWLSSRGRESLAELLPGHPY